MNESGLPGVALDDRDHVCVFYRGAEERDDVLSAFFGAGYAEGDKCLCIADDHDVTAVAERLDPARRRAPGQLTVLPSTAYLTDGRFRPDRAFDRWDAMVGGFVDEGYGRVRASGELSWFLRRHRADGPANAEPASGEGPGPLLEYEALCNRLVQRRPATIFCLYDLDLLDAGLLPGVLARHPTALARGLLFRGPWRIEDRPGGANDALLLANQLLAGARSAPEVEELLDGLRRAVVGADTGAECRRFLLALDGLAAPYRRAAEAETADLARRLFDGAPLDEDDEARLRPLGVDLAQPFRAVVVRPAAAGAPGAIRDELADRGFRLVDVRPAEVAFLAPDGGALDPALDTLADPAGVVGVGRAHTGVAGAARSYAEAGRAADFAAALDRPVLRHEDLGLFSLLADGGDPAAMGRLVDEWLGPLLTHDGGRRSQTLLPTLAAYLDAGGAQQATADALGVHVSTLKYRLGRLEGILGRDLSEPTIRFQLQVALTAHRTLTVLHSQGD